MDYLLRDYDQLVDLLDTLKPKVTADRQTRVLYATLENERCRYVVSAAPYGLTVVHGGPEGNAKPIWRSTGQAARMVYDCLNALLFADKPPHNDPADWEKFMSDLGAE